MLHTNKMLLNPWNSHEKGKKYWTTFFYLSPFFFFQNNVHTYHQKSFKLRILWWWNRIQIRKKKREINSYAVQKTLAFLCSADNVICFLYSFNSIFVVVIVFIQLFSEKTLSIVVVVIVVQNHWKRSFHKRYSLETWNIIIFTIKKQSILTRETISKHFCVNSVPFLLRFFFHYQAHLNRAPSANVLI